MSKDERGLPTLPKLLNHIDRDNDERNQSQAIASSATVTSGEMMAPRSPSGEAIRALINRIVRHQNELNTNVQELNTNIQSLKILFHRSDFTQDLDDDVSPAVSPGVPAIKSRSDAHTLVGQVTVSEDEHDNLRSTLMSLGHWYENVDETIDYCQQTQLSSRWRPEMRQVPKSSAERYLSFFRAIQLHPKLGMENGLMVEYEEQSTINELSSNNSPTELSRALQGPAQPHTFTQSIDQISEVSTSLGDHSVESNSAGSEIPTLGHQSNNSSASNSADDHSQVLQNANDQPPKIQTRSNQNNDQALTTSAEPSLGGADTDLVYYLSDTEFSEYQKSSKIAPRKPNSHQTNDEVHMVSPEPSPDSASTERFYNSNDAESSQPTKASNLTQKRSISRDDERLANDTAESVKGSKSPMPLPLAQSISSSDSMTISISDPEDRTSSVSSASLCDALAIPGSPSSQPESEISEVSDGYSRKNVKKKARTLTPRKRTRTAAPTVIWTKEEEAIVLTFLRGLSDDVVRPDRWPIISEKLSKHGYTRSASSIYQRWYNKFRHDIRKPITATSTKSETTTRGESLRVDNEIDNREEGVHLTTVGLVAPTEPKFVTEKEEVKPRTQRKRTPQNNLLWRLRIEGRHIKTSLTNSTLDQLRNHADSRLNLCHTWTGASHDVINVDWSPDGYHYAAGSAALADENLNAQYNRPNNLLLGNAALNTLSELPDHYVERKFPDSSTSDSRLFTTISALQWSNSGGHLYSSSYDKTVKVWDTEIENSPRCVASFRHEERVQLMTLASDYINLLVTGTNSRKKSLRAYYANSNGSSYTVLPIPNALSDSPFIYSPNSVRFSKNYAFRNYVAAGFGGDGRSATKGYLGLWRFDEGRCTPLKISPRTDAVNDVTWSPNSGQFATGNSLNASAKKILGFRTSVRVYSISESRAVLECECPALDMNDVTFCPYDDQRYLTASCTDGATYVWDRRRPNQMLHQLQHGLPASEFSRGDRETDDPGVRFAEWGYKTGQLYTGATDGVIKLWDIRKSPEDVLTANVASFGIELMCGRLSPDKTNLLIGDACGSIHLLSKSAEGEDDSVCEIDFFRAPQHTSENSGMDSEDEKSFPCKRAADELVESGQISIHPTFGPGKGPAYSGPYARWARAAVANEEELAITPLDPEIQKQQRDQTNYHLKRVRIPSFKALSSTAESPSKSLRGPSLANAVNDSPNSALERIPALKIFKTSLVPPNLKSQHSLESLEVNMDTAEESSDEAELMNERDVSESEDCDENFFPPHWAVDANIVRVTEHLAMGEDF